MTLQRMLSGDPARSSLIYLAIGGLSLVKAIAVRNDPERFRRELIDAALFLGVGLVLRRYSTVKERKRDEIREAVPDWVLGEPSAGAGLRELAMQRLGGEPEPEPEPSFRERARRAMAD